MSDMKEDVFAETSFGRIALKKLAESAPLNQNFRLFEAGWMEDKVGTVMEVIGAEFKIAKSGPNKGKMCMMVPGTRRKVYVYAEEMS